jgi:riboflavin synthase alpha subunit
MDLEIKDVQTKQTFKVDASENTVTVKTTDGHRVKLHPVFIRNMIPVNTEFDGHTLIGTRKMRRIR